MDGNQHKEHPKPRENLKQRAYLNSVTSVLDYGARIVTNFVVTPFLVSGLGSTLFGVWNVLGQFTSYTNIADIKVTQVLKWAIAKDRDTTSEETLREYVTATFLLLMLILPFILMLGAVVVWFAPQITGVGEEFVNTVRITAGLLVLALVVNKVFDIFESVLRGMNLSFKRIGVRAAVTIIGGILQIAVIFLGFGLIGLALVQVFIMLSMGITIYVIMKKHVPWFGWGEVNLKRTVSFSKISGWFVGSTGTQILLLNTDKVLLGYLAGPMLVTQYVITKYLANAVHGGVRNIIQGVFPGIGKLYGNRQHDKLLEARKHVMLFTWQFSVVIGAVIILFNESFISLWIGEDEYAGQFVNFLILLSVVQYLFVQNDGVIIDTTLELSQKVYMGLIASIISIALMSILIPRYEIIGLCISLIIGRAVISLGYPWIVYLKTEQSLTIRDVPIRLIITMSLIWGVAYWIEPFVNLDNWITLIAMIFIFLIIITPVAFFSGIDRSNRKEIITHLKKIAPLKGDR